jgi:hypothetical protein
MGHWLLVGEYSPEFAHETRLPDTRLAGDRHQVRLALGDGAPEDGPEQLELALPADERTSEPAYPTGSREREGSQNGAARETPRLPLGLDNSGLAELERSAGCCNRPLAGEHLPGGGRLLQPGADIDGVTRDERAAFACLTDDHLARVDAYADGESPTVELDEAALHGQCGVKGPFRVVLEGCRSPESGHYSVARELLDRASSSLDLLCHRLVEAIEHDPDALRILVVGECGRADEIREENRDELALFPDGHV